ncbi:MAG: hypothetical protein IKE38_04800 [Erysipelotrichaceae bacterium]|nr:hypothetical protein [Erysipelotrichaceae bacterium]
MKIRIIFHDITGKQEEEIDFDHEPTCHEAALALMEKQDKSAGIVNGSIYLAGKERLSADSVLSDGTVLDIYRVLNGG